MILPRDIFETTKEYVDFLLYLYSVKAFTVEQLSLKFNISNWVLYKRVKYWEEQDYINIISTLGEKGGKQYHYQITKKLDNLVKALLTKLQKGLN